MIITFNEELQQYINEQGVPVLPSQEDVDLYLAALREIAELAAKAGKEGMNTALNEGRSDMTRYWEKHTVVPSKPEGQG